ncbi:MAG: DivIVA domain-containing protein [Cellulomonadaceae bacterium]|nr:DivIVA domain-containing protein [Cellulomonadaceae bacterium]
MRSALRLPVKGLGDTAPPRRAGDPHLASRTPTGVYGSPRQSAPSRTPPGGPSRWQAGAVLSSHDVLNMKFAATKFREGYDQDEVDDFLDRVTTTLMHLEGGAPTPRPVTAAEVLSARFQATKFREGYDQQAVDAFLDVVAARLADGGTTPAGRPSRAADPAQVQGSTVAPGMVDTTRTGGLLGWLRGR